MNKIKRLQEIQKRIKQYLEKYKNLLRNNKKTNKKIQKNTSKVITQNKQYFKVTVFFLIFLFLTSIISLIYLKSNIINIIEAKTDKNTIIKVNEDLINNKIYVTDWIDKLLSISITNIWTEDINIVNKDFVSNSNITNCDLKLSDYINEISSIDLIETKVKKWETNEFKFLLKNNKYNDSWILEVSLNCNKNKKNNEKYSNKININYEKNVISNKNILILNTTLKPIVEDFSEFNKLYSNLWNKIKYMSSVYESDLKNYKQLDLKNKIVFYHKDWLKNNDFFIKSYNEIKKIKSLSYINWYEILELNKKNLNYLYLLWNCENLEKKCNPYKNFDNLNLYYNYFSPKMTINSDSNIDYMILIPSNYK